MGSIMMSRLGGPKGDQKQNHYSPVIFTGLSSINSEAISFEDYMENGSHFGFAWEQVVDCL